MPNHRHRKLRTAAGIACWGSLPGRWVCSSQLHGLLESSSSQLSEIPRPELPAGVGDCVPLSSLSESFLSGRIAVVPHVIADVEPKLFDGSHRHFQIQEPLLRSQGHQEGAGAGGGG